ncbi:MAG TPA: hypothetical protein VL443_22135 [Cyclobacteriaceae bacterium]|jgi:hypothetical protein|nr:hypothetical protein [Cyclobacteriaceae bacterium]
MKKVLGTLLLFTSIIFSGHAQKRIGGMAGYATGFNDINIGANAEFFIFDKVSVAPDMLFYFPVTRGDVHKNWIEFNLNGHYYFYTHNIYEFYGIGGMNYTITRYKYNLDNSRHSKELLNINVGGGVNFKVAKNLIPFSEIRFVGFADNIIVVGGLKFDL